jgi:large subunit ribosomal protein L21
MKSAIIFTGGKQYIVKEGNSLRIEKIDKKEGAAITFDKVLFFSDGKKTDIGAPFLKTAKVTAKILKQARADKVHTVKFKSKIRYRRTKNHRQPYTLVKIEKITVGT